MVERNEARADLADIKKAMWAMLKMDGVGAEELAVGLALIAAIAAAWPQPYEPDEENLARLARVDKAIVQVALAEFTDAGVLHSNE